MIRKFIGFFLVLVIASAILLVSVFRNASIKYAFTGTENEASENVGSEIDYELVYPGTVLPDHPLWPLKVVRDKAWLFITFNKLKKAEISLVFADKRLVSAKKLFEKDKSELGYSTLTKAEKYLEEAYLLEKGARDKGTDTSILLNRISLAALKHMEVIETILEIAPEDAKPHVVQSLNYPRSVYMNTKSVLLTRGQVPPENPFE